MNTILEQDLMTLRARIAELEDRVTLLYQRLGIPAEANAANGVDSRIFEALQKNNKIEAIKIYRELTGLGLAEAKAAIDELAGKL
ncbi:MAG: ribosomal protein L7/L12 [Anaerolineales bacterium]|nr:ribosomal protein L7/L12 [Anaerolineales bacterium]